MHSSVRDLLLTVVFAAQLIVISGCLDANRAADKYVEAIDKRMKKVEKDASNVNPKRNSESSELRGEGD